MKIDVASDLHIEVRGAISRTIKAAIQGGEVLILAGDIFLTRDLDRLKRDIEFFTELYEHVFYVPGNHEFYKSTPQECWNTLLVARDAFQNFTILDHATGVKEFKGQRFIGGTMWFRDAPMNKMYENLVWDFGMIKDFVPWVYEENARFISFMEKELKEGDIVVTHHLPSHLSVHPYYHGQESNRFFLCEMTNLILDRKPKYWFHGHTHEAMDYKLGDTRVYANPLGYPSERDNHDFFNRVKLT